MKNSKNNESNLYLITGATGNVGGYIVEELLKSGNRVRALTRNPANADFPEDVEVVSGDLSKPETLTLAFEGVTGVHFITIDGDGFGPLGTAPELVELAEKAGVQKVTVLWSGVTGPVEEAVKNSRLDWTVLQPQEFMSNVLDWAESIRTEGVAREAFIHRKTAMIHPADIASVAATALTEEGHSGKEIVLTGPEVLTPVKAAEIISENIGLKFRLKERTEKEQRRIMEEVYGVDQEMTDYVISWIKNPPPEAYAISPLVEQITGQPPRTFRQWVNENKHRFIE